MTEHEWLKTTSFQKMRGAVLLEHLTDLGRRRSRLFTCACARHALVAEPNVPDHVHEAVGVGEDFSDHLEFSDLQRASACLGFNALPEHRTFPLILANYCVSVSTSLYFSPFSQRSSLGAQFRRWVRPSVACFLMRCIFGNPWRPAIIRGYRPVDHPEVVRLARVIYRDRLFQDLPILADALEDNGFAGSDAVHHLRTPGPHAKGCWALDLILGKS